MGRHGGSSRSGGSRSSSSSRSRSSSRSGGSGSSTRTSTRPFAGCYNRSYYDRRGRYHSVYTTDTQFGTGEPITLIGWIKSFIIITVIFAMIGAVIVLVNTDRNKKINGPEDRIAIVDTIDIFTAEEERNLLETFNNVYKKSGMPVTIVTNWLDTLINYASIEMYSEDEYYSRGFDEKSMVVLFLIDKPSESFIDWNFDIYCGDGTYDCLSDSDFDILINNCDKMLRGKKPAESFIYGFEQYIYNFDVVHYDFSCLYTLVVMYGFLAFTFVIMFLGTKSSSDAAQYFKENPDKFQSEPMKVYSSCPNCGAANSDGLEKCMYCDSLLKLSANGVTYVKPN